MKKLIISLISVLIIGLILTSIVFETQAVGFDVLEDPDRYKQQVGESGEIVTIGNVILSIIRTLGTAVSVVMLMIVGIKYIMGSVEEKAEYKQTMWPYIVRSITNICRNNNNKYNLRNV